MARMKQGILGGISGKIGSVVGGSWKGIATLRSMPLSVANPRTAPQVEQRDKMTGIVKFAQQITGSTIKPLWDRWAQKMSGFNDFVKTNISLFEGGTLNSPMFLKMSKGKIPAIVLTNATASAAGTYMNVTFPQNQTDAYSQSSDEIYCVVYNPLTEIVDVNKTPAIRSDGAAIVDITDMPDAGDTLYLWVCCRREDGTIVSDSTYRSVEVTA